MTAARIIETNEGIQSEVTAMTRATMTFSQRIVIADER